MLNKNERINFKDENIFVGIDVHKNSWKVTVQLEDLVYQTFSQEPQVQLLEKYLKRNFPNATFQCAYEAGFSGFWLQQELEKKGIKCIVVNPADIPTTDKEKKQKTDKRDSKKIARSLKNGELEAIYVPSVESLEERSLVRARATLVRDMARSKCRIKSNLYFYGINLPEQFKDPNKHWSKNFYEWLKSIKFQTEQGLDTMQTLIDQNLYLREKILKKTQQIRKLSKTDKFENKIKMLCTIPGVGLLTAMTILTELHDIKRFKDLDNLCAYIGFVPNTNSSGEKEKIGKITNRGNKFLKNVIIESSWVAIRNDTSLLLKFKKLSQVMEPNKAIIRIAKKMINRVRYVLINNKAYETGLLK